VLSTYHKAPDSKEATKVEHITNEHFMGKLEIETEQ